MDDALRASLWNFLLSSMETARSDRDGSMLAWEPMITLLARDFFKVEVDTVPLYGYEYAKEWLRKEYRPAPWWKVYNLIEFLVHRMGAAKWFPLKADQIAMYFNSILAEEFSAYRFVSGKLVPISNATEVDAIEEAIEVAKQKGYEGLRIHLETALAHFGHKPDPDYRNSIKESISAVESAARQIGDAASLKDALAIIEKKVGLHGGFKSGLLSLYGYTSDEDGIRHAILESPTVGFDEAKFMLVSCSAFANFLLAKAATAGFLK